MSGRKNIPPKVRDDRATSNPPVFTKLNFQEASSTVSLSLISTLRRTQYLSRYPLWELKLEMKPFLATAVLL